MRADGRWLVAALALATTAAFAQTPPLLQQMAGTWNVEQRTSREAGAPPQSLPPAVAHRRVVAGAWLDEAMESVDAGGEGRFTRHSVINYNAVDQRYEYFSIDSRAPQMMNERGSSAASMAGGTFVAPGPGPAEGRTFGYRIAVGNIEGDRQVVRLFLTPRSGPARDEFLSFEYVYTRQR